MGRWAGPDGGREGFTFTTTRSIGAMDCASRSAICAGVAAFGEDAGVDRVVERLHLAADERRHGGQVRDRRDVDAFAGEVLARPVGRVDLDAEGSQVAGELRDPVPIRDGEKGSHRGHPPDPR